MWRSEENLWTSFSSCHVESSDSVQATSLGGMHADGWAILLSPKILLKEIYVMELVGGGDACL